MPPVPPPPPPLAPPLLLDVCVHVDTYFLRWAVYTETSTEYYTQTARDKAVKEAVAAGEIKDDDIDVIKVLR